MDRTFDSLNPRSWVIVEAECTESLKFEGPGETTRTARAEPAAPPGPCCTYRGSVIENPPPTWSPRVTSFVGLLHATTAPIGCFLHLLRDFI